MIYGWFFKLKEISGSIESFMWNLPNGLWGEEEVEQRSAGDPLPLRRQKVALQWACFIFQVLILMHLATGYFCEFRNYRNTRNDYSEK